MAIKKQDKKPKIIIETELDESENIVEVLKFNNVVLSKILRRLDFLDKKFNKVISMNRKINEISEELNSLEEVYVQDHSCEHEDNDENENNEDVDGKLFWN